ncbi:MAG: short-chain fatty acyl-CoA regulator family protein [Pseudoruegeria sp.]
MPRSGLIGNRIRERRASLGIKQAELARRVSVSPSYLNLIEHNKRRIGGKLLVDLARELEVETSALSEGAAAGLLAAMRDAASGQGATKPELDKTEELAGRFPGWAALIDWQHRHISTLERTVETLTDRLTHDPFLSASLHEVLSSVTSIRSTATILNETKDIEPEWRERFHRNIADDSLRLTESAQSLVSYLDKSGDAETTLSSPEEELESWMEVRGYHVPEIESEALGTEELIRAAPELTSSHSRTVAKQYLQRYAQDAVRMPLEEFEPVARNMSYDPARLAIEFGVDLSAAMRRISVLPDRENEERMGLVVCDSSGTLVFRKPPVGFALPRFGAACPLWPLYQALTRPMAPIRKIIRTTGRNPRSYLAYAMSQPAYQAGFDHPEVFEATMLLVPDTRVNLPKQDVLNLGASCRICAKIKCAARREPSILSE